MAWRSALLDKLTKKVSNFETAILVLCLAPGAGYLNVRVLKLPTATGLMTMARPELC
ncbi:MAG TPA: hypothetical protein VFX59_01380 [Polyangiales bacterium]|nr:hypothetical protein [Polyangiales bacterium]